MGGARQTLLAHLPVDLSERLTATLQQRGGVILSPCRIVPGEARTDEVDDAEDEAAAGEHGEVLAFQVVRHRRDLGQRLYANVSTASARGLRRQQYLRQRKMTQRRAS